MNPDDFVFKPYNRQLSSFDWVIFHLSISILLNYLLANLYEIKATHCFRSFRVLSVISVLFLNRTVSFFLSLLLGWQGESSSLVFQRSIHSFWTSWRKLQQLWKGEEGPPRSIWLDLGNMRVVGGLLLFSSLNREALVLRGFLLLTRCDAC